MTNLVKKQSAIHETGIFAAEPIAKNTKFYEIPLINILNAPKTRCAYIGNNKYVSDEKVLNWINHSCEPNTLLDISTVKPNLVALKDIKANEEITCDYNLTEAGGTKVVCTCGSVNCKGYFLRRE
jgi:SET domain-containing protein